MKYILYSSSVREGITKMEQISVFVIREGFPKEIWTFLMAASIKHRTRPPSMVLISIHFLPLFLFCKWIFHIQGDFFYWASPHFEKVLSMAAERGEIPNSLTFLIPRGGQSGTLTFFWNKSLTGQHLANSGEAQLKKSLCISRISLIYVTKKPFTHLGTQIVESTRLCH